MGCNTVESENKEILALTVSKERNMSLVERCLLSGLIKVHGKRPISPEEGT